uniref:Uncharacterized protein n=1 Tax=Anguilla anguilla TaxID=7936 RepID=A0A0E9QQB9_ANGAN
MEPSFWCLQMKAHYFRLKNALRLTVKFERTVYHDEGLME